MHTAESCNTMYSYLPDLSVTYHLCSKNPMYHMLTHQIVQVRDCGSLLTVGGFNIPAVDVDDITIHYKDFKGVVNHIR